MSAGDEREGARREAREGLEDVRERVRVGAQAAAAEAGEEGGSGGRVGRGGERGQEEVEEVQLLGG